MCDRQLDDHKPKRIKRNMPLFGVSIIASLLAEFVRAKGRGDDERTGVDDFNIFRVFHLS
jgi:hypothetical protein